MTWSGIEPRSPRPLANTHSNNTQTYFIHTLSYSYVSVCLSFSHTTHTFHAHMKDLYSYLSLLFIIKLYLHYRHIPYTYTIHILYTSHMHTLHTYIHLTQTKHILHTPCTSHRDHLCTSFSLSLTHIMYISSRLPIQSIWQPSKTYFSSKKCYF